MDEERCKIVNKAKVISPNACFLIDRKNHVKELDDEKKSTLSILPCAFSKSPRLGELNVACHSRRRPNNDL